MGSVAILFLLAQFISIRRSTVESLPSVKRILVWPAEGQGILTPQFSADGKFIVLNTRGYEPDGDDAEGLPDSFFKDLEAKEKANPRFADPVVKVINLNGEVVCEAQYGWSPSLSPDDKRIVFSEQVKPITGFRTAASTMSGNAIQMYDCETKQLTRIAEPQAGYLDTPFFSPDGQSIIFTENEAVNGAFGGPVGISRYDLEQNRLQTLVSEKDVPAVPCPLAGPKPGACLDVDVKNLTKSFPQIVHQVSTAGNEVVALLGMPVPAPGDIYLARDYDVSLISVLPEPKTILSFGKRNFEDDEQNGEDYSAFQAGSDGSVLIFLKYWKRYSLATGNAMADLGPRNAKLKSAYSPNLKYYLCAEPEGEPDHFVLYRTSDGKLVDSLPKMAWVYEATWSADSREFATIGVPMAGVSPMHHIEQITVYSIQ